MWNSWRRHSPPLLAATVTVCRVGEWTKNISSLMHRSSLVLSACSFPFHSQAAGHELWGTVLEICKDNWLPSVRTDLPELKNMLVDSCKLGSKKCFNIPGYGGSADSIAQRVRAFSDMCQRSECNIVCCVTSRVCHARLNLFADIQHLQDR